jgi:hypothetical protein
MRNETGGACGRHRDSRQNDDLAGKGKDLDANAGLSKEQRLRRTGEALVPDNGAEDLYLI